MQIWAPCKPLLTRVNQHTTRGRMKEVYRRSKFIYCILILIIVWIPDHQGNHPERTSPWARTKHINSSLWWTRCKEAWTMQKVGSHSRVMERSWRTSSIISSRTFRISCNSKVIVQKPIRGISTAGQEDYKACRGCMGPIPFMARAMLGCRLATSKALMVAFLRSWRCQTNSEVALMASSPTPTLKPAIFQV